MITIGSKRLVAALKKLGLSEREAADRVGCGPSTMHRYLAGERSPAGKILFRIEKEFGIEGADFFTAPRKSNAA